MLLERWMFDLVILGIAAEGLLIRGLLRRSGAGAWARPALWFLVSGALLMLAVRSAITGAAHSVISGLLAASLVTHLACLRTAWTLIRKPD
ncbi:MAG: hypothetical protein ACK4HR_06200 [Hyphomonas sp.]|jgi:hypothetical protein